MVKGDRRGVGGWLGGTTVKSSHISIQIITKIKNFRRRNMCLVLPLPDPQTQTLSTTFEEGESLLPTLWGVPFKKVEKRGRLFYNSSISRCTDRLVSFPVQYTVCAPYQGSVWE